MSKSNTKEIVKMVDVRSNVRDRVIAFVARNNGAWEGTMTELLTKISTGRKQPETLPGSGSALRRVMNSLVRSIRRAGYRVEFTRTTDKDRMRLVRFMPVVHKQ